MVRTWSDEVGNARSVLDPLIAEVFSDADVTLNSGGKLGVGSAELLITFGSRHARAVVTFEAWEHARNNPDGLRQALRKIAEEIKKSTDLPAYLITTRGLDTESSDKETELLSTIAHVIEADILAERFFSSGIKK
jgi:hypothetical protein